MKANTLLFALLCTSAVLSACAPACRTKACRTSALRAADYGGYYGTHILTGARRTAVPRQNPYWIISPAYNEFLNSFFLDLTRQ